MKSTPGKWQSGKPHRAPPGPHVRAIAEAEWKKANEGLAMPENLRERHLREKEDLKVHIYANRISQRQADQLYKEQINRHQKEIMELESRPRRRQTAQEKLVAMRNQARLRVEAISYAQREEQRQIQSTRRVFKGEVVGFNASTRVATVRLPSGQTIPGRMLGRGAPVGSRVVITIPLGSAIATIQTPEPRC